jgi:predicted RNase H-like nuclease
MLSTSRVICQVFNEATTQSSIRQFTSGGAPARRKRGSRQRQRNLESASRINDALNLEIKTDDAISSVPQAFFILAVFPIIAMGGVLFIRDDLRKDFKQRLGLD